MRIAQVAPLFEPVPPRAYGGTERVVSYLTEEMVARGHRVTLFASGDSETRARLVVGCDRALRLRGEETSWVVHHMLMLEELFDRIREFDVVHCHIDLVHYVRAQQAPIPVVTTMHGRLDLEPLRSCYRRFRDLPFVSISDDQRRPVPDLNWIGTVHHGLPLDLHTPVAEPDDYLAFLGRMSPEKGCQAAFEIARRVGLPLRVAGKLDRADERYWREHVLPVFDQPGVEYVGEIGGAEKDEFLGNARAVLFPIDWPEPFGLVMIEAMACGTPVIAFRRGSVPEVLEDGLTGFIVDDVDGAVAAVARVANLDRRRIRRRFEQRFSVRRMTDDYLALYRALIEQGDHHGRDALRFAGGTGRRAAGPVFRARRPRIDR